MTFLKYRLWSEQYSIAAPMLRRQCSAVTVDFMLRPLIKRQTFVYRNQLVMISSRVINFLIFISILFFGHNFTLSESRWVIWTKSVWRVLHSGWQRSRLQPKGLFWFISRKTFFNTLLEFFIRHGPTVNWNTLFYSK